MSAPSPAVIGARSLLKLDVETTPCADDAVRPARFTLMSDLELDAIPEADPLVDDFAFENSIVALIGRYGTMKTFVLLDIALCIGVGADWHGRRVRQGPVVYVYAEGAWGIRKRVAAWKAAMQYDGGANVYFLPTSCIVSEPGQVAALLLAIDAIGITPRAVMIDTVARNMGGDESKVEDMGRFIRGCDTIREATGAAVFLAHHTGWSAERSRGSTSLPGAVNTEVMIERDDSVITLKCTKQKDAPEFAPITLEAFPIAESLAFRTVVPTRAELTRNERHALTVVQMSDGLTATKWMEATDLAKGSFMNARKRLLALAYVRHAKNLYVATEAGTHATGTRDNAGTTQVQTGESSEVQHGHTPLGVSVVPDLALDLCSNAGSAA